MSNYRKKPVVIQAHQWFKNGDHPDDGNETFADGEYAGDKYEGSVVRYFRRPDVPGTRQCSACGETFHVHGWIDTLEGGHIVCPGDWIITGVAGERYPCKPHIFTATYEPAESPIPAAVPSEQSLATIQDSHQPAVHAVGVFWEDRNGALRKAPSDCQRFGANGHPDAVWCGPQRFQIVQHAPAASAVPDDMARDAEIARIVDAMESVAGPGAPYASAAVPRYAVLGWAEQIRALLAAAQEGKP